MQIEKKNYKVIQIKTPCLSQYTYYIESAGKSIIIDPIRDTKTYQTLLTSQNSKLLYIIQTHIHADYISGQCSLQKKTSAEILLGKNSSIQFKHRQMKNKEEITVGKIKLRFLATPGHTLESMCILLLDENREEILFTGDTLFVGDVGRPDLAVVGSDERFLARELFRSLKVLKKLDFECVVFPGHGKGSACGKNISSDSFSSIGKECLGNYAMLIKEEKTFVEKVMENISKPPDYFFKTVEMNLKNSLLEDSEVVCERMKCLDFEEFGKLCKDDCFQILDTRCTSDFKEKHFPRSINSPLKSRFAIFSVYALHPTKKILIISDKGDQNEACIRLLRTGLNNIYGYLKGGFQNYEEKKGKMEKVLSIEAENVVKMIKNDKFNGRILDVRNCGEFRNNGKVKNAINLHLEKLELHAKKYLDPKIAYYVSCGGGLRSVIAWGILRNQGFKVININNGFKGLKENGVEIYFEK